MPFEIIRNDITRMHVDAIVDATGFQALGLRQQTADPSIIPALDGNAEYVIRAAIPAWQGGEQGEIALLRQAYDRCLRLAAQHRCDSIAFPLLAVGNHGFPKDIALQVAISAFSTFLLEQEMQIYLVLVDQAAHKLSENLFRDVARYIDRHRTDRWEKAMPNMAAPPRRDREIPAKKCMSYMVEPAAPAPRDLQSFLQQKDAGFVETLLELIQKSGQKNSAIYKRANISKQHFSKLINDPKATITKPVAVAFALALELDLAETRDLIGRAGYTLNNSNVFDLIIRYHIENKKYNVVEINCVLYEFDQSLIGT